MHTKLVFIICLQVAKGSVHKAVYLSQVIFLAKNRYQPSHSGARMSSQDLVSPLSLAWVPCNPLWLYSEPCCIGIDFPEQQATMAQLWNICPKSRFPTVIFSLPELWKNGDHGLLSYHSPTTIEPPIWPFQNLHLYEFLLGLVLSLFLQPYLALNPCEDIINIYAGQTVQTNSLILLSCSQLQRTGLSQAALNKWAIGIMTTSLLIFSMVADLGLGRLGFLISSDMLYFKDRINRLHIQMTTH